MSILYLRSSVITLALLLLARCGAARFIHLESDGAPEAAPGINSSPELPTGYDSTRMIVNYRNGKGRAAARAAASSVHLDLADYNAMAVSIPKEALQGLVNNPNIENVEMDAPRYFASHQHRFLRQQQTHNSHAGNDVDVVEQQQGHRKLAQGTPYGITMVQAEQISDHSNATNAKKICIIDSGYSLNHPDLPKLGVTGYGTSSHWGSDRCSHGTHVAGTIAAINNDNGVRGVVINNPMLHIVKVFGDDCSWAYVSSLVFALDQCKAAGAKIVSMSLGGSFKSGTEQNAFDTAYNQGILSIAAAGNGGNTKNSYPASYTSVVSVAAIDERKNLASFSQRNSQVELAAPGVGVRSTVYDIVSSLEVGGAMYDATALTYSGTGSASGDLVDCGLMTSTSSCSPSGKVCLIQRGDISFADKVKNCKDAGGVAAVIYNNAPGNFAGTLGSQVSGQILAVSASDTDGAILLGKVGMMAVVQNELGYGYASWDGTSMATPHVAGVAALVWSHHPGKTNAQIRTALQKTAEDLGSAGKDNSYGYGLVQAKDAVNYLL